MPRPHTPSRPSGRAPEAGPRDRGSAAITASLAPGRIPAWLIVGDPGAVSAIGLLDALRVRRRRGQCLHCGRRLRCERLVEVRHVDEVSGCRPCALSLHNAGVGRLCPDHFQSHLRGRWSAEPDDAPAQANEFRHIL
jgi:hypothetical protein